MLSFNTSSTRYMELHGSPVLPKKHTRTPWRNRTRQREKPVSWKSMYVLDFAHVFSHAFSQKMNWLQKFSTKYRSCVISVLQLPGFTKPTYVFAYPGQQDFFRSCAKTRPCDVRLSINLPDCVLCRPPSTDFIR